VHFIVGVLVMAITLLGAGKSYTVGKIVKTKGQGSVTIIRDFGRGEYGEYRGSKNRKLIDHDTVRTDRYAKAYILLLDGSRVFVDIKSDLQIIDRDRLFQRSGSVEYDIQKQKKRGRFQIVTRFARINVKGTLFRVIDEGGDQSIRLDRGSLDIDFGKPRDFYSFDPRCEEVFTTRLSSYDQKSGETLRFVGNDVFRECHKGKGLEDAITLFYKPRTKQMHRCASFYKTFYNATETPRIQAVEEGCYLNVASEYESCEVVKSHNTERSAFHYERGRMEFLLIPESMDEESFILYQCQ